jgi:hypothetical protein
MRPVRTVTAVVFAAAIAVTGCAAHSAADRPSTPSEAAGFAPAPEPAPKPATQAPTPPKDTPGPVAPNDPPGPVVDRKPVLADGRYDAYIQQVNTRGDYLVVDLVQVFHDQAAVDAAVADGQPHDRAQVLSTYVRNQNPRLRTLPLAEDLRLELHGGCEEPVSRQLAKLAGDARAMSGADHTFYFTLTVSGGAVHRVQEFVAINAC